MTGTAPFGGCPFSPDVHLSAYSEIPKQLKVDMFSSRIIYVKFLKGEDRNMYLFQFWENVILFSIGLFKICSPNLCPPYLMFLSKQITGIISESHSTSPAWIYSLAYENFPTWGMNCMPSGSKTRALQCQAVLGKTSCIQIALKPS